MRKISLKTRSLIKRCITSLLTAMGFFPVHAADRDRTAPVDEKDPQELDFPDSTMIALYGCPYADFKFTGHVTDKNGNPLNGVEIQFTHCDYEIGKIVSDEAGNFQMAYQEVPWCDIKISAKNDYAAAYDTIPKEVVREGMVPPEKPTSWMYEGVFSQDITIMLDENGEMNRIIFNSPGSPASSADANAERVLLFENPVENYLWFNMNGAESAVVSIYDFAGKKVMSASVLSGGSLYVGDLKSGNYLLTVISGEKKQVAKFLKK